MRLYTAYMNVYSPGALHVQLANYLHQLKDYNQKSISEKFKNHNLPQLKINAYKVLRKTMRKLDLIPHGEISALKLELALMIQRVGTKPETLEFINEIKPQLWKRELFLDLWEVITTEIKCIVALFKGTIRDKKIQILEKERDKANAQLQNYIAFNRILNKFYIPSVEEHEANGQDNIKLLSSAIALPIMKSAQNAQSERALIEYYMIWRRYYFATNQPGKAHQYTSKSLDLLHNSPWLIEEYRTQHFADLARAAIHHMIQKNKPEAQAIMSTFQKTDWLNPLNVRSGLDKYIMASFNFWYYFHQPATAENAIELTAQHFETLHREADPKSITWIYFWHLRYYFDSADSKSAAKWLQAFFQFEKHDTKRDLQLLARLFHLIMLFEENDEKGLASFGKNYARFADKHLDAFTPITELISILRHSAFDHQHKKTIRKVAALEKKIKAMTQENPEIKKRLEKYDFDLGLTRVKKALKLN
jgi:hypothetical protein